MKKINVPNNNDQIKNQKIHIIHHTSNKLVEINDEHEVFDIIKDAVSQILPGVFFVVTKLQTDDMNFRIIESSGFDKYFNAIKKLVGKDPFTMDFPFKELSEEQLKVFASRKIYFFSGGIYELVVGRINKLICKGLENLLGISVVCALGFTVEKKYFGGISLFIPKSFIEKKLFDSDAIMAIETISNLASIFLQKIRDNKAAKQYEEEFKISQTRFNQLVNQLNDIVWIAKGDGSELVDLNNSFEKIYGYSSSEFNKDPNFWMKIVYPEDKKIAEESAKSLFSNGNSESEYRIVRPDGEIRWLRDRKSIIYDQSGKAIQMGGKATDITEQKELEEKLHITNFALEASPTAVGLADMNGILFYANEAYVKLWRYNDVNEVIGNHVSHFANSQEQVGQVLSTIQSGEVYYGEGESTRMDGTIFTNLISARIVKSDDGKPICLMALFIDITDRKQFEIKLTEQNLKLGELISTKDKLFSIIAHDLKNPFNSLLGLADILITDYYEMSDQERLRIINLLNSSSKNAFILLENLLDWASIQRGKIKITKESLNVKELVNESTKPYMMSAIKKQITIKNSIPNNLSILADKNTMRTVIGNIFSNATKYTYSGGIINFSAHKENKNIKIEIRDNGLGMNELKLNNLFKLDKNQSTPGTENEKGTGLGLIVCKEFISNNDGVISVESEIGKGSLFRITIPAS